MRRFGMGIVVFLISSLIALSSAAGMKGNGFTVSGIIKFPSTGSLYLQLVDEEEFNGVRKPRFQALIDLRAEDLRRQSAAFSFADVPEGTYVIQCFQDVNGNGKMDFKTFGRPAEPWGTYRNVRPLFRGPKFKEIAFRVQGNMDGIEVTLR